MNLKRIYLILISLLVFFAFFLLNQNEVSANMWIAGTTCPGSGGTGKCSPTENCSGPGCSCSAAYTLTVTKAGPSASAGVVSGSPAGISCGSSCSAIYSAGTVVTLTASSPSTVFFAGWSGACSGINPTCTVTIDAAKTVTATFDVNPCVPGGYCSAVGNNGCYQGKTYTCQPSLCALGVPQFQTYTSNMAGCFGQGGCPNGVTWTNAATLCAPTAHVCTISEYISGGGATISPSSQDCWYSLKETMGSYLCDAWNSEYGYMYQFRTYSTRQGYWFEGGILPSAAYPAKMYYAGNDVSCSLSWPQIYLHTVGWDTVLGTMCCGNPSNSWISSSNCASGACNPTDPCVGAGCACKPVNNPPVASISCHPYGCGESAGICKGYTQSNFCLKNNSTDPQGTSTIKNSIWNISGTEDSDTSNCLDISGNNLCNWTLPSDFVVGAYSAELKVEDQLGLNSTVSKTFDILQDIIAEFDCSFTAVGPWQKCTILRASEGEIIYFRDKSTPSQEAQIANWSWAFDGGTPAAKQSKNASSSFERLTQNSGTVTLTVIDSAGRQDTISHKIPISLSLPEWKETPAF